MGKVQNRDTEDIKKLLTSEMNYHGMMILRDVSNSENGLVTDDRFMITILVLDKLKLRKLAALKCNRCMVPDCKSGT